MATRAWFVYCTGVYALPRAVIGKLSSVIVAILGHLQYYFNVPDNSIIKAAHNKPAKWHVRPAKTQISLGIR